MRMECSEEEESEREGSESGEWSSRDGEERRGGM